MLCQEAFEAMSAVCDGELAAAERAALDAHLAGCAGCRSGHADLTALNRRLRGAAREQAAPPPALVARIARLVTPKVRSRRLPFAFGFALVSASVGLAAFAIVASARPTSGLDLAAAGNAPCRLDASTATSEIAAACARGGVAGAKAHMRQVVAGAQARGIKVTCSTCHRDSERFELREDARERLSALLPLQPT